MPIGAGLAGPAGLTATVYSPGVAKVAAFAFDAQGRLWFATADYSDTGADGLYLVAGAASPPELVVGGLHTPLGLVWYQGSLYVTSTGHVDAYTGFDGTRFATQPPGPDAAGRRRREQHHRGLARRPPGDGDLRSVRPLLAGVALVGIGRVVPS